MTFHDGRLHHHYPDANEPREINPISMLFSSLAEGLEEDAVGVVLSGTGSDGALGLKAIKEKGGLTLVQGTDGTGPQHDGMPLSAIATGAIDIIAPSRRCQVVSWPSRRRDRSRMIWPSCQHRKSMRHG